jgi:queuosine precursor transporter
LPLLGLQENSSFSSSYHLPVNPTRRASFAALAFTIYAGSIVLSNWLITHYAPTPVAPGLAAPAGVWAAALSFPARDVTQRLGGRTLGIIAIITGATLAYAVTQNSTIAAASATTYLISESADFAIYTPLSHRHFALAVILSSTVAVVVDSAVFLHLAQLPSDPKSVAALTLGKLYVIIATIPVILYLRRSLRFTPEK